MKRYGGVDKALGGGDHVACRAAQLLGARGPREGPPNAHQQRVIELDAEAVERVARRSRRDREQPSRPRDVRLLEQEVQRAHVIQVQGR